MMTVVFKGWKQELKANGEVEVLVVVGHDTQNTIDRQSERRRSVRTIW